LVSSSTKKFEMTVTNLIRLKVAFKPATEACLLNIRLDLISMTL